MDSLFGKRNKSYLQTRCSDDLTNYARRKLRKCKQPLVATPTVKQQLDEHYTKIINESPSSSENVAHILIPGPSVSSQMISNEEHMILDEQSTYAPNVMNYLHLLTHEDPPNDSDEPVQRNYDFLFDFFESDVVNVSPGELLMMILKFCTLNHLPHTVMSKLITLINTIFDKPILPQSRYMLDKLFNPKDEAVFYFVWSNCGNHIGKLEDFDASEIAQCKVCKKEYELDKPSCENLFLMINPSTAIQEIIQSNEEYYDYVVTERHHEKSHLKVIFDGKKYREFTNSLLPEDKNQYATISFNTDRAAPFKSSKYSA